MHTQLTSKRSCTYITKTPYVVSAWKDALNSANLTDLFPNLIHDITYGSPIGNLPPLNTMFIPKNRGLASVGELPSGLVPGHFCWTRDPTVPSLTQFLGLGPGLPQTIYISLVLVQTGSRQSLHILFIYLSKIKDSGLMWDGMASSSHW